jgi:putative tryptophan/tyrosine transport system substrate-binding protein
VPAGVTGKAEIGSAAATELAARTTRSRRGRRAGLVAGLARPGGNVTGLSNQSVDVVSKRVELLRDVVPSLRRCAVLSDGSNPVVMREAEQAQAAARALGLEVVPVEVRRADDIVPTFAALDGHADALYVPAAPLFSSNANTISVLALKARMPDVHSFREEVVAGGLLSYGASFADLFRRAAESIRFCAERSLPTSPSNSRQNSIWSLTSRLPRSLASRCRINLLVLADEVIE